MKKVELLAPAKDLIKAKTAIRYGADAVYIGGKSFSLRSRASNFGLKEIDEIVKFAHSYGKKIYVTSNIVFHDEDFYGYVEYLESLEAIGVDAIIVESYAAVQLARKYAPSIECHLSTQINSLNSEAIKCYARWGVKRVVLAREVDIDNMALIAKKTILPLEVFIHGGMCSNYSGRCTLSNRMTLRDANRGGCAQSCRWKYELYDGDYLISDEVTKLSMSSKDLCALEHIEKMVRMGVDSLKIEGRMKSDYYIAQVVKTYRKMIDEIYDHSLSDERLEYYRNEFAKAENRPVASGFLDGKCDADKHLYGVNGAGVTHEFVGYVLGYQDGFAKVEVRNHFAIGNQLEVFGPHIDNERFEVVESYDEEGNFQEVMNKPMSVVYIRIPFVVERHDMIRKAIDR
ncbi:MAG: U32 family peptidase [Erysipelotrichaceae bacterium]|nr:U32 family peptidase [Erysipelotrichaceae bacterium]